MRTRLARVLAPAAVIACVVSAGALRAQEDETPDQAEVEKIAAPFKKAMEALQAKDYPAAIRGFDDFFAKLEKAKVPEKVKKGAESSARYNYACALALTGKKAEAVKAFARSVELGFWDWDHIDKDSDLDSIRGEEDFKKAVASGKELEKAQQEKEAKEAAEETKKALAEKPLFDFDFTVKTLDGKTLKLSDLKDKVVIVDVWGTWCPPCRAEIPHFVKLHDALKEKGLEVVGLACENEEGDDAVKLVKEFAAKNGMKYPLAAISQDSEVLKAIPGFEAFPTTIWVDRGGKVRVKKVGYHGYSSLEAITKTLLEAKAEKGN